MRLIIAGSRTWADYDRMKLILATYEGRVTEVVSGKCPTGADKLGERWAKENKLPIKPFPADWASFGRSAGPRRNRQMAEYGDELVLFWDGTTNGSQSMFDAAKAVGIPILSVTPTTRGYY